MAEHGGHWLGGLDNRSVWPGPPIEVEWERGFIVHASIPTGYDSEDSAFTYRAFAELPSAALVRELALGVACTYGGGGEDDVSILEALRDRPLPCVKRLALREFEHQISWTHVGDITIARLGELDALHISAGRMTLGAIDLPRLRRLRLESGGLRAHVLASVAAARWPLLEELDVYIGTPEYGGTCTLDDVGPLLAGTNLPRVTSLGLRNSPFADELVARLVSAPILPRLTSLDLQYGTIGADGAREIVAHAEQFEHLIRLDLGDNYIPPDLVRELAQRLPRVEFLDQRIEDDYGRFVALSE